MMEAAFHLPRMHRPGHLQLRWGLQEDGSCLYPVDIYGASNVDSAGEVFGDEDGDGVCLEDEVYGCQSQEAQLQQPFD